MEGVNGVRQPGNEIEREERKVSPFVSVLISRFPTN
jgi:hypothetical protein